MAHEGKVLNNSSHSFYLPEIRSPSVTGELNPYVKALP